MKFEGIEHVKRDDSKRRNPSHSVKNDEMLGSRKRHRLRNLSLAELARLVQSTN
jgi:hypothetical protein